jgi:hypothetical protein
MDELDVAFRQAWAANYTLTGEQLRFWDKGSWPLEAGGYWFDGLVKLGYALHDDFLLKQAICPNTSVSGQQGQRLCSRQDSMVYKPRTREVLGKYNVAWSVLYFFRSAGLVR